MITKDDDDDDGDKLPARHHAIIKWLVSDFYREWSLYKKNNNKRQKVLANMSWSDDSSWYLNKSVFEWLHLLFIMVLRFGIR